MVYAVLVLTWLVYTERRLIEPRLTGARLSVLARVALVYIYGSRLYGMTPVSRPNQSYSSSLFICSNSLAHFVAAHILFGMFCAVQRMLNSYAKAVLITSEVVWSPSTTPSE